MALLFCLSVVPVLQCHHCWYVNLYSPEKQLKTHLTWMKMRLWGYQSKGWQDKNLVLVEIRGYLEFRTGSTSLVNCQKGKTLVIQALKAKDIFLIATIFKEAFFLGGCF